MWRFLALLMPFPALASPPDLPSSVTSYRGAHLPNGCMIEAIVFADWYMEHEIDGADSWAHAVFIRARLQGREIEHAVALFRFAGKFYLWDLEWGCMMLPKPRGHERSIAHLAEETYQAHLTALATQAQGGIPPPRPSVLPITAPAVITARERLRRHRPTLLLTIDGQEGHALAVMVQDRLLVYAPAFGTTAVTHRGPDVQSSLQKIVTGWCGTNVVAEMETMTLPEPVERNSPR